jgi:hypothetical protein
MRMGSINLFLFAVGWLCCKIFFSRNNWKTIMMMG